jgi:uroporphyrin-III C-methyltransferase/precorrin-2 dehydrogenase/sirohydrochlorin ferrochelatase
MHAHPQSVMPSLADRVSHLLLRVTNAARALVQQYGAKASTISAARSGIGRVSLVGAGPGDPELLTRKALRALQEADVVLHDQLVSPEVLALAPPHAERIDVGKKGYGRACSQGRINDLMVALAVAGRRVVRLKAGDPLMFGRLEEEITALQNANITFDVVPGISAAQGAAGALKVPLTRRRGARRFQAITGHADNGLLPDDFDWAGLADPKVTTAVYMPKATIGVLCRELMQRGLAPDHPAVAVFNATRADEAVLVASLSTLSQRVAAAASHGPCIILIGVEAAQSAEVSDVNFEARASNLRAIPARLKL